MKEKRLCKARGQRMVCGVCGGIAEYFNVDPTLVRLAFLLLAAGWGSGLLALPCGGHHHAGAACRTVSMIVQHSLCRPPFGGRLFFGKGCISLPGGVKPCVRPVPLLACAEYETAVRHERGLIIRHVHPCERRGGHCGRAAYCGLVFAAPAWRGAPWRAHGSCAWRGW